MTSGLHSINGKPPEAAFPSGLSAFIFDMDGTIIDSTYDWTRIRRRLDIGETSIIDALNGLDGAAREEKWALLRSAEEEASTAAGLKPGAVEVLALLREKGLRTALVTNNSEDNTRSLLDRFDLEFDVVLTRDSGLWKPSGAPLTEAMRLLGVQPGRCASVGDSRFDVLAAADAGCGCSILLGPEGHAQSSSVDLHLPDLHALLLLLRESD